MNRADRRLWWHFGLVVAVVLILSGLLLRRYVAHTLETETQVQMAFLDLALRDRSRYLAETLQPLREQGDWPWNLADLLTRNHADFNRDIFLQVFETDGRLVAASANSPPSLPLSARALRDGTREVKWLTDEATTPEGRSLRLVTYPIYAGNPGSPEVRVLGFAQAGLPLPDAARAVARFTWVTVLGLSGLGILLLAVARASLLAAAHRLAQESESLRAAQHRFVADAAHEFGTPLAILRGEIDIALRRERTSEEYRAALTSCREEIERLSRLSENLLALATAETGRDGLSFSSSDAAALARAVQARFARPAAEKQVSLKVTAPAAIPWTTDPLAVERILENLLGNALRHTPPGESIEVTVAAVADQVVFQITDTGEGIPPTSLPRLFERFHRVDRARSRSRGGAGLGLSLVKTLVEALGGSIEVSSEVGKGSRFTCRFPLPSEPGANPWLGGKGSTESS